VAADRLAAIAPGDPRVLALGGELGGEPAAAPPPVEVDEPVDGAEVLVEVEHDEATEELQLGDEAPPPEVESGVAVAGTRADVDLGDELAEIDFYVQQGLLEEARDALSSLRALYPDEPALADREDRLRAALAAAGAPTGPDTMPPSAARPELHYSVGDALQQFRRGVEQQVRPEDAETHYDLGIAYKEMGLLDEALQELGVALAARPGRKEVDCLTMIGLCRMQQRDPAGAIAAYRAALQSEHAGAEAARALNYELAMAYQSLGDAGAALWFLNKVLREDPGFRDVRGQVAALGDGEGRPPPDEPEAAGAPVAASS
jgi:tetratricopeptide (TPR) repeat protein